MNKGNVWALTRLLLRGFYIVWGRVWDISYALHLWILRGGSSSILVWLCWLWVMNVKLWTIFMNMACHDEILHYECTYEVGCLMWYLALHRVMGFYSFHWKSIALFVYMLGWYLVGLAYDAYFMCILDLLGL